MKLAKEALLTQLGFNITENTLKDLDIIIENTTGFNTIKNHIIALNDHLKTLEGYVTMSSSKPYLKIKISNDKIYSDDSIKEVRKWADKYNVKIDMINDTTFYVLGVEK